MKKLALSVFTSKKWFRRSQKRGGLNGNFPTHGARIVRFFCYYVLVHLVTIAHCSAWQFFFFNFNLIGFIYLLRLGNYEQNGCTRQTELWNACRVLNIPAENITLINATQMQDDPTAHWKSPIIAKQILKQVHSLDIDLIITFDREGISHHANHCAIFFSSVSVYVASLLPAGLYYGSIQNSIWSKYSRIHLQVAVFSRWIR